MGAELQQLVPSLSVTIVFAAALAVVARSEEGYTWWKAVLIILAGALTALGSELLVGIMPSAMMQTVIALVSLLAVMAVIALGGRFWLLMSWRDASLVGVGYVLAQAAVSFSLLYFQDHPL